MSMTTLCSTRFLMSYEAPCNIVMRYHETVNAMQHNYLSPTHHQSVIEARCVHNGWDLRLLLPLMKGWDLVNTAPEENTIKCINICHTNLLQNIKIITHLVTNSYSRVNRAQQGNTKGYKTNACKNSRQIECHYLLNLINVATAY